MTIKPIETSYAGYRFRSRLEARWAVFFTALGLQWEYEPEGFDLGEAGRYLPDFYLPEMAQKGLWVEVKPNKDCIKIEDPRCRAFVDQSNSPLLLAIGTPAPTEYGMMIPFDDEFDFDFVTVCFASKYLPPRNHDGAPRLFWFPGGDEDADCDEAIAAARSARFEHGDDPSPTKPSWRGKPSDQSWRRG